MHWVVNRPVATWMITIAIFVFGIVSYQRLPLNLMPNLSYPTITVKTEAEGYAPEEVEDRISRKIEEAIATTQGITKLESRSRAGNSEVLLSFNWGTDINDAIQDVRERLQRVFFEDDIQRPLILRYDPSLDPILRLTLSMKNADTMTQSQLRVTAEKQIKRDLEALDGVAAVKIRGGLEKEAQIKIREDWMAAKGLSLDNVTQTLSAENINLPGGSILEGDREYLVRTINAFQKLEELNDLKIRRADGEEIPLSEVAEISYGFKDRTVLSRINTTNSVELEVYKAADANIVFVSKTIKKRLFEGENSISQNLPEGMEVVLLADQAEFIEAAIDNLRSTAFVGAFFAMLILFVFLRNFRSTLIISTAIPLSVIVTFAPMFIYDVSLNLMSLGGLALGIGMLVDNAVVVLENIQVKLDKGMSRKEAAAIGSKEVAMAVTASTLTTISVFLPITFVEGAAGQIFGDLSLSVVFSLISSLVVALFFVPMLAASEINFTGEPTRPSFKQRFQPFAEFSTDFRALSWVKRPFWLLWGIPKLSLAVIWNLLVAIILYPTILLLWILHRIWRVLSPIGAMLLLGTANFFYKIYQKFDAQYGRWINPILNHPGKTIGFAVVLFIGTASQAGQLGQSLLPELQQGRFTVDMEKPIGTPLAVTAEAALPIEKELSDLQETEYVYAIVGSDGRVDNRSGSGEHSIRLMIGLNDQVNESQAMEKVRAILEQNRDFQNIKLSRPALFSFDTPVEVLLYADELNDLQRYSTNALKALGSLDNLTDLQSSLAKGYPEIQINYDRDMLNQLGLDSSTTARLVRKKISGERATTISTGDQRIDLTVRLAEKERQTLEQLKQININPQIFPKVPLETVAQFSVTEGPSEIRRIDQQRAVVLSANIEGFDLSGPAEDIAEKLQGITLENWEIAGQSEEMRKSLSSMQFALALAIFLVYVIMASTFESVLHPLVILFSVPMALIGVIIFLVIFKVPLSVIVLIGIIVLAGVVVNNAIVLVDTINRLRAAGKDRMEATIEASKLRLRPILITTLTTILGLLPLAMGFGEGAEIQQPLAITIISGLFSATFLTLLIIPSVYLVLTKLFEAKE